jgi:hypothetical protein
MFLLGETLLPPQKLLYENAFAFANALVETCPWHCDYAQQPVKKQRLTPPLALISWWRLIVCEKDSIESKEIPLDRSIG